MPYRIYATNQQGQKITRMDLNPASQPITDRAEAKRLAERWADSQTHAGPWRGHVEYYDAPTANPLWNRQDGSVEDPVYTGPNVRLKAKQGQVPVK